jgi:hypothetical protein
MKKIAFLCGALLSTPLIGMELVTKEDVDKERTLWPRHLTPLIMKANFKSHKKFLVHILACVNKELSEDVPYENVRLTWKTFRFDSPLSLIIKHRKDLLFQGNAQSFPCIPLKRDRYLTVAKRFLENKADSNMLSLDVRAFNNKMTLLQQAAYLQDKELCKLFLEHGGDPYITTVRWESQGPGYDLEISRWTAFDYANKLHEYGKGDDQPHGWLKELWDEVSSFAKATADKQ